MEEKNKSTKKKTVAKKTVKKAKIIHPTKKNKLNFIVPIVVIIALVLIIWGINVYVPTSVNEDTVLVTVNGEPISQSELNLNWEAVPIDMKVGLSREQLLEEMITEKLLLSKAKENGMIVTDEEVELFIQNQIASVGMTQEDFEEVVSAQGLSVDELKEIYKKQLTISNLFETLVTPELNVTDEEINTYYEENKESFYQDETVTVKHILVATTEEFNDSAALERTELITNLFSEGKDFCELVSNYSSDLASVDACGEYTFGKGEMVEEFENASFEMEIGEIRTVKTQFGYHIILKIGENPAKQMTLDDEINTGNGMVAVSEIVRQYLTEQKAVTVYEDYVSELRLAADINYKNEISEETENVSEDMQTFAQCLTDKGVKMYGAYWCSHCNAQKEAFGDAAKAISYVECDAAGENPQVELCTTMEIEGFPTWIINGVKYPGEQSFERLAALSGCDL